MSNWNKKWRIFKNICEYNETLFEVPIAIEWILKFTLKSGKFLTNKIYFKKIN
jgi:hypothetical protein